MGGKDSCETTRPYIHALQQDRRKLKRSRVYVFLAPTSTSSSTPLVNGQILTLPAGSIVMDALEELRLRADGFPSFQDHGNIQVWCNGKIATPDESIKNGDMLLIQHQPSLSSADIVLSSWSSVNKTVSNPQLVAS